MISGRLLSLHCGLCTRRLGDGSSSSKASPAVIIENSGLLLHDRIWPQDARWLNTEEGAGRWIIAELKRGKISISKMSRRPEIMPPKAVAKGTATMKEGHGLGAVLVPEPVG